MRKDLSRFQML